VTPLDVLADALQAAGRYDEAVQARPEAILWCDPDASFAPLMPALRRKLPQLHSLGAHDAEARTGPAFAFRIATAEAEAAGEPPPILWAPGVGREMIRDAEACPEHLEPLAWLVVSGNLFGHVNGKDWSLRAFLTAERGSLRLDVADGAEAREALGLAAPHLFSRSVESLRGIRFDAERLHALSAPDLEADVLEWIEGRLNGDADPVRFKAFALRSVKELGFDPRKRPREEAARLLAGREGGWSAVWGRFEAGTGDAYGNVVKALDVAEPPGGLFEQADFTYPAVNARAELRLRSDLLRLADMDPASAAARLIELEAEHGARRGTIWARRGEAALACALEPLAIVATAPAWPHHDAAGLGRHYAEQGAAIDGAALIAMSLAPAEADRAAVTAALRSVYLPWVDQGAHALQAIAATGAIPFGKIETFSTNVDAVVFVDGLRFDLARRLMDRLTANGAQAILDWRWSGFPTSTSSCKPLVSPVAHLLTGAGGEGDVQPRTAEGRIADHGTLRRLMAENGYVFDETEAGKLWIETGTFDEDGHKLGARLAGQIGQGIDDAAQCILNLIRAGRRVRVVTDHGWLLVPGNLPKATLGVGLTEPDEKRTRYARLKPGATTAHAQAPWSWNTDVRLAMAPGASSFYAAYEYAHGGVSPQECVVPVIDVEPLSAARKAEITLAAWTGLRLRVQASGAADLRVDLRTDGEDPQSSLLTSPRSLDEDGRGSMVVSDDYEGRSATLVVIDDGGRVLARRAVTVGT
jgi:hypothetical protein